ncbi:uncharacterized protein A4U43_C01F2000 [Asparagus officinalis]|uniref:Uncharacterized protein n=1 Tax=Asparagus officinalis TaxID=4686 RepID=A0A5P1FL18_ASPOF|nr:uncharacterized protein A4U43_C01F2000 [Asparagus officinalis]
MEARAETSNAPQESSPPHRLEMSMSVLPDGTCVYCHVVPPVPAAVTRGSGGVHPVSLSEFKKLGRPRKCELFKYAPVGVTACTTSPLPDGSVDGAGTVGIVSPVVAIAALGLFREKGHLCVLPANGVVSQAVLHQAESSVAVSYERINLIFSLHNVASDTSSGLCTGPLRDLIFSLHNVASDTSSGLCTGPLRDTAALWVIAKEQGRMQRDCAQCDASWNKWQGLWRSAGWPSHHSITRSGLSPF